MMPAYVSSNRQSNEIKLEFSPLDLALVILVKADMLDPDGLICIALEVEVGGTGDGGRCNSRASHGGSGFNSSDLGPPLSPHTLKIVWFWHPRYVFQTASHTQRQRFKTLLSGCIWSFGSKNAIVD